jgi:hypothetical protein
MNRPSRLSSAAFFFTASLVATLPACKDKTPKPTYDPVLEKEKRTLNFVEVEPHIEVMLEVPKNLPAARYVKASTHGFKMEAPYDAKGYLPLLVEVDRAHLESPMPKYEGEPKVTERADGWYTQGMVGKERKIASLFRIPESDHVVRCTTTWMSGMPGFDDPAKIEAIDAICASIVVKKKD